LVASTHCEAGARGGRYSRILHVVFELSRSQNAPLWKVMRLQTKLSVVLLTGISAVIATSSWLQNRQARRQAIDQATAATEILKQRELENTNNFQHSIDFLLGDTLERGEMDIFKKIVQLQAVIPGMVKFSLYDGKGKVAYSSDAAALRTLLPPELKASLLTQPDKHTETNADHIRIYQPQLAKASCLECHPAWKPGEVAGVTFFEFSNDAAVRLATQLQSSTQTAERERRVSTSVTLVSALFVVIGLVLVSTRSLKHTIIEAASKFGNQSDQLKSQSAYVAQASTNFSENATEQAASLEETSASLEELSSMTKQNAVNALKAKDLANEANSAAQQGSADMEAMKNSVEKIRHASDDVAKIVHTIEEIAFQTNLLALNAAVEAARAGETGLGFAVVADEVRNLARRCAEAAKETSAQIENALSHTAQGVDLTNKVATGFKQIVNRIGEVDKLVAEVAAASNEQNAGIAQLNTAVVQMDKLTQANAASAEETASAAEQLNAQAHSIEDYFQGLLAMVADRDKREQPTAPEAALPKKASPQHRPKTPVS
jgi:methyl-accepting chemotaxis protein